MSALLSAALLPTVLARRLALRAGARAGRSAPAPSRRADRVRARLARGRGAVPLAPARLEAAARLLEPRAHGRDRARDRVRHPARAHRRRRPHRRARNRESARLLRRDTPARGTSAARQPCRHGHRPHPAAELGATLGISLGTLAGLPPSPSFVSELLIVAGGFESGRPWAAAAATLLLALGFVGLDTRADRDDGRLRRTAERRRTRSPGSAASPRSPPSRPSLLLALTVVAPSAAGQRPRQGTRHGDLVSAYTRARLPQRSRRSRPAGGSPASTQRNGSLVRALLVDETERPGSRRSTTPRRERCRIVDLAPAGWDEREAVDLYGVHVRRATSRCARSLDHEAPLDRLDRSRARPRSPTRSRSGRSMPA